MRLVPISARRLLLTAALSALPSLPLPAVAGGGLSREAISGKLSRVPIFVITNGDAAPYLTEVDGSGRRSGFFFVSPQEAIQALNDIKAFDPRASLSVVPLDDVFFDIAATAEEAARAPQPSAGTSTDLKLFRLRQLADENESATRLSSTPIDDSSIPLFYEPSFFLPVDGTQQQPYFFRLGDLRTAFEAQKSAGGDAGKLNDPPTPRVVTLAAVVKGLEQGQVPPNLLLVAASEASAVVARMSGGAGGEQPPRTRAAEDPARKALDGFFLSVPFAKGLAK